MLKGNKHYARYIFLKMRPDMGETTAAYVTRLREKAHDCDFGTNCDERILEHLIQTIENQVLIQKCISKSWTLQEFLIEAGQSEDISLQMREMKIGQENKDIAKVEESRRRNPRAHWNTVNNIRRRHDQLCSNCALTADLRFILRGKTAQPTVRNAIIVRDTIILQPSVDPIKANIYKVIDNQVEATEAKENAE